MNIAKLVQGLGPKYVLVKGGHSPLGDDDRVATQDTEKTTVVDVLHDGNGAMVMKTDYSSSKNTHGTGCSLACKLFPFYCPTPPPQKSNYIRLSLFLAAYAMLCNLSFSRPRRSN